MSLDYGLVFGRSIDNTRLRHWLTQDLGAIVHEDNDYVSYHFPGLVCWSSEAQKLTVDLISESFGFTATANVSMTLDPFEQYESGMEYLFELVGSATQLGANDIVFYRNDLGACTTWFRHGEATIDPAADGWVDDLIAVYQRYRVPYRLGTLPQC